MDVLELVSSSMYVEPLTVYREYVQNAADAIDDARAGGVLQQGAPGQVDITVDPAERTVRIRDNGTGVPAPDFLRRLTAFGASTKRGKDRRGLRGVGRLAGLGYCQELLFRSRAAASDPVHELRWDCRQLRSLLRAADFQGSLGQAVTLGTGYRATRASGYPPHFFEVELRGLVRHGKDDLLSESAIRAYLGQVAPVPFSLSFPYREAIESFLGGVVTQSDLEIFVNGVGPIERPHSDAIAMRQAVKSRATELNYVTIPATDGEVAAKGWILHHEYLGAIPPEIGLRGLRLRSGNMQVGDDATLDSIFAEPRFNAWSVGEFHILDRRIVPNGRRDQYEQSVHWANVLNHLAPVGREIVLRCRSQSQYRQTVRKAEQFEQRFVDGLAVLRQGAISAGARRALIVDLERTLHRFERLSHAQYLSPKDQKRLAGRYAVLRRRADRATSRAHVAPRLRQLSATKRRAYEEIFSFIYDCATDVRVARELVGRVLVRIRQ